MKQEIRIRTSLIAAVAKRAGQTPEEYISESRSICCGRKVCAHFLRTEGDYSVFSCL
jgi:hypothetical protein